MLQFRYTAFILSVSHTFSDEDTDSSARTGSLSPSPAVFNASLIACPEEPIKELRQAQFQGDARQNEIKARYSWVCPKLEHFNRHIDASVSHIALLCCTKDHTSGLSVSVRSCCCNMSSSHRIRFTERSLICWEGSAVTRGKKSTHQLCGEKQPPCCINARPSNDGMNSVGTAQAPPG